MASTQIKCMIIRLCSKRVQGLEPSLPAAPRACACAVGFLAVVRALPPFNEVSLARLPRRPRRQRLIDGLAPCEHANAVPSGEFAPT